MNKLDLIQNTLVELRVLSNKLDNMQHLIEDLIEANRTINRIYNMYEAEIRSMEDKIQ